MQTANKKGTPKGCHPRSKNYINDKKKLTFPIAPIFPDNSLCRRMQHSKPIIWYGYSICKSPLPKCSMVAVFPGQPKNNRE
jgi:hypothetical protein